MQTYYTKWYSPSVGREMEIKVYGTPAAQCCSSPAKTGAFSTSRTTA